MAYAFSGERRTLLPQLPSASTVYLYDTGVLIHPTPPPTPPLLPRYFVPVGPVYPAPAPPCSPILVQSPLLTHGKSKVVIPKLVLRLNPIFLAHMDKKRTESLLQFIADEGLEPSSEQVIKRLEVIDQLKEIVLAWIKKIAWLSRLPKEVIASTSATVLTYGSYGLGIGNLVPHAMYDILELFEGVDYEAEKGYDIVRIMQRFKHQS